MLQVIALLPFRWIRGNLALSYEKSNNCLPTAASHGAHARIRVPRLRMVSLRILLVDDNEIFIAAMRRLFTRIPGVEIVGEAMDGREGLATFDQLQPDVILSDISMPVMDGLELAGILRTRPKPPVIIFMSSHQEAQYVTSVRDLGALALIDKSDVVQELVPLLQSLVAEHVALQDAATHAPGPKQA